MLPRAGLLPACHTISEISWTSPVAAMTSQVLVVFPDLQLAVIFAPQGTILQCLARVSRLHAAIPGPATSQQVDGGLKLILQSFLLLI